MMNKKNILMALAACILASCGNQHTIVFDVTATGLESGVFVVKDPGQQTVFGENVRGGKCELKGYLEHPGFYMLDIVKDSDKPHIPFEVYLDATTYTVTTNANDLSKYPTIVTDSKKQTEITNYNTLAEQLGNGTEEETARLNHELEANNGKLSQDAYKKLLIRISSSEDKEHNLRYNALEEFVKKYPDSELSAHFMARQNYSDDPDKYLKLFNRLSPVAQNSDDGKEISKTLAAAVKLQPGQKAPDIAGKTFDGKSFSAITNGKKLFLIDFWRSVNQFSRINHEKISSIYSSLNSRGFEIISVSLDSKETWWKTAVHDDKLPWPQMSDLKGNDSPNAANWGITTIPTYYLITSDWKIYKKDIGLSNIQLEASQYLEKHP